MSRQSTLGRCPFPERAARPVTGRRRVERHLPLSTDRREPGSPS